MQRPDATVWVAVHESAHAVMLLALGYTPTKIIAQGKRGGQVESLASIPFDIQALSAAAGAIAERTILCNDGATPSAGDIAGMHAAAIRQTELSDRQFYAAVETRAAQILFEHEDAVIELANALLQTPVMTADKLRDVCRGGKALRKFARLFPAPKPAPVMRASSQPARAIVARDVDLADIGLTRRDLESGGMRADLAAILASR